MIRSRHSVGRALRAIAAAAALAALLPAVAVAQAPAWQRYGGRAPGGDDLAVIAGTPYVAWSAADGVHVARLTSATGVWQPVGGAIHRAGGSDVQEASIAGGPDGNPWVAWTETDIDGVPQARVASFDGAAWHEAVGGPRPLNRPQTAAYEPQLEFFEGRPYLAWLGDSPSELTADVARLSQDGSRWEELDPGPSASVRVRLAVSGGNLYLSNDYRLNANITLRRLNAAGDGWDDLPAPPGPDQWRSEIADVGGRLGLLDDQGPGSGEPLTPHVSVLGAADDWQAVGGDLGTEDDAPESLAADGSTPYAATLVGVDGPRHVIVRRFESGAWSELPSPSDEAADAQSAKLAPGGLGGGMWVLFSQADDEGNTTSYVAGLGVNVPTVSGGGGEPPTPSGACANEIVGTGAGELLNGTNGGDSIFGGGGRDKLFGLDGDDCLFGGSGRDGLSGDDGDDRLVGGSYGDMLRGGRGGDFLEGDSGPDTLYGGSGRDDINGNAGRDRIFGGSGRDEIAAGSGNDRIDVHGDGADLVDCGPGRDTVILWRNDLKRRCERVILRR